MYPRWNALAWIFAWALAATTAAATAFELPRAGATPGALGAADGVAVSTADVCTRGYARRMRHPYDIAWRHYRVALFRAYGIPHARWSHYTIDHLVPIELGGRAFGGHDGAWDLRNVWPQPRSDAKRKDAVEDALHAAVCFRRGYHGLHLTLIEAERAIARNWTRTAVGLPAHGATGRGAFRILKYSRIASRVRLTMPTADTSTCVMASA